MFKYYSHAGAVPTLQNVTVQLSAPAGFNDPFDTHLDDPLGLDPAEFVQELQTAFLEFILGEIDYAALRDGPFRKQIILMNQALAAASAEQREGFRRDAARKDAKKLYDIPALQRQNEDLSRHFRETFSRYGIFCISRRPGVLLMWSHYASEHKGYVFEFTPNIEKDSSFLAARPVIYTRSRPLLYRTPADMIRKSLTMSREEATKEIIHSLVYSKADEWSYEEEERLYIPNFVEEGRLRAYLEFYPEELSSIYIGCRALEDPTREVLDLARRLNPAVTVRRALMDPREYRLGFVDED